MQGEQLYTNKDLARDYLKLVTSVFPTQKLRKEEVNRLEFIVKSKVN